jgi:hypothetical protein
MGNETDINGKAVSNRSETTEMVAAEYSPSKGTEEFKRSL